ncbi:MAG: thr operon leader peptide [Nitrosopumilaceae archaeon]|nr:thr operon leader peptide [Nitrosopumilaceae archaeon]
MNKYSIITLIAIIVIAIPVLYGFWNIYSIEQIQIRTPNDEFSYFDMANYERIELCNPTPFFVTINGLRIDVLYRDDEKGTFLMGSQTLGPESSKIQEINFSSDNFSESQYLFMHMDGQLEGEVPIRIDPTQMILKTTFDIRIIGIIPYQSTFTQSGFDFTQMMNENSLCKNKD